MRKLRNTKKAPKKQMEIEYKKKPEENSPDCFLSFLCEIFFCQCNGGS